ncbi:alpha/beta fold hydrolase [Streptomyces spirodelae]|uniref:Alpha/beta hydrolase n=1 Tax=Streptomyces spirodelae TaxID=2812904 RepID=A0ABS3X228_9ACTN|nr:alpha/beta hydrolase [Streptomyces spirodelae]MBO8189422.1 alpha/beta hydrolase [Streptomyces spirodelae]
MVDRDARSRTLSFSTPDGALAYRDTGTGQPVVLLHGGFLDHTMWEAQIAALAPRFRVIAPDARGHGASANATRPFRPADDLAALLRHLDAGPAVLVGLSMGGGVAVDTALEHSGSVRAVVVSGVGTSEPFFEDPWSQEVLAAQQRALTVGDVEGWVAAFLRFAAGPHRGLDEVGPGVVERLRAMALRTVAKHTAEEPDHLVPVRDTWQRAARIDVPVLAVNGALDSTDHLAMADRLVRTVSDGCTAPAVEGAAHYPNMENPAAFNAALTNFLRGLPE